VPARATVTREINYLLDRYNNFIDAKEMKKYAFYLSLYRIESSQNAPADMKSMRKINSERNYIRT